jgi:hypothetical protein
VRVSRRTGLDVTGDEHPPALTLARPGRHFGRRCEHVVLAMHPSLRGGPPGVMTIGPAEVRWPRSTLGETVQAQIAEAGRPDDGGPPAYVAAAT